MVGGVVVSVLVGAVGAILDYAVTENTYQHGVNLNTVGVILMIVGAIGVVLSVLFGLFGPSGFHRRRTVIDDGNGRVVRREDSYI